MMILATVRRLVHILAVLSRHGLAAKLGHRLSRVPRFARWLPPSDLSGPDRLCAVFEDLGGSFIKLGQMLALQPDILPLAYCNALYDLLDRVSPVPFDAIDQVFLEDVGQRTSAVFDDFDETPLASGSIGQVHVATYKGQRVAVKIQRPDAQSEFRRDIELMRMLTGLVRLLHLHWISWVIDPLSEFGSWTAEELDFRCEAKYIDQVRRNGHKNAYESVPRVQWSCTTKRILVMEFLEGVTLLDHMRRSGSEDADHEVWLREMRFDPEQFAFHIIDNFLGDAFTHGIFHADLHPANLVVLPDNAVGYIDFGITGVISRYSRANLVAMTLAYARRDAEAMCTSFFSVSTIDDESDLEGFRAGLKTLFEEWSDEREPSDEARSVTLVMLDMLRLSRRTGIWPQRDVIKYIRSSIAVDGLIKRFAPAVDVSEHLASACRRYLAGHYRRSLLSHDSIINWWTSNNAIARTGVQRVTHALEHTAARAAPDAARSSGRQEQRRRNAAAQANQLLIAIVAIAAILVLSATRLDTTTTLLAVEAGLMLAAIFMFLRRVRFLQDKPRPQVTA